MCSVFFRFRNLNLNYVDSLGMARPVLVTVISIPTGLRRVMIGEMDVYVVIGNCLSWSCSATRNQLLNFFDALIRWNIEGWRCIFFQEMIRLPWAGIGTDRRVGFRATPTMSTAQTKRLRGSYITVVYDSRASHFVGKNAKYLRFIRAEHQSSIWIRWS